MQIDCQLLQSFEAGLDPQNITASGIPAQLVGYGEISAIFNIDGDESVAYKRLPLFKNRNQAEDYESLYHEYCELLTRIGICLPETRTMSVEVPGRPVALYIAQKMIDPALFCHRLIHSDDTEATSKMLEAVLKESSKIWAFCRDNGPALETALDGQLSNWAFKDANRDELLYVDTSTPFIRQDGVHRIDPALIIQAAPKPLRGIFSWIFVDDVLNRYYEPDKNMIDLVGNLYKEQKPDLIPHFIEIINRHLPESSEAITEKAVEKYYRVDKMIWAIFLGLRRLDRWITTRLFRRRYEFILPGKVQR